VRTRHRACRFDSGTRFWDTVSREPFEQLQRIVP
jgi:hypothetical protein